MATVYGTEPNDYFFQANAFNLGDTIVGSLSSSSDWDFYKLDLAASGVIKLDISTALQSNWAYTVGVYDAAHNLLAADFFGHVSSGSFTVGASAGTYYIGVTSNNIYSSVPYTIVTSAGIGSAADYEKESNDTQATANAVLLDHVITGQRSSSTDVDYFSVNVDSSGMLTVDFRAPQKYSYAEYQVSIYDVSGKLIDSRTAYGNMTLVDQVSAAGNYYLRVEGAKGSGYQGGDYKFMAHFDLGSTLAGAPPLTNAIPVSANISAAAQHNWYKLNLTAGGLYEFGAAGSVSGNGTLATPSLSLCASDGRELEYSTNLPAYSGGGTVYTSDPQISFVAPYSGTFYLMVDGLGGTGSYTVQQTTDTAASLTLALLQPTSGGFPTHWGSGPIGSAATVTYSFMNSSSFATTDGETGYQTMTDSQKQVVRDVLAMYSLFANITFTEVIDPNTAQIRYGTSNQSGISSGVTYPDWNANGSMTTADVFLNNASLSGNGAASTNTLYAGGYGYETLIHETGHALGLKHPGNYNGVPGTVEPPFVPATWDSREYSVMSYIDDPELEVSGQTPGWLDVAAIQYLYGARNSTSSQTLSPTSVSEFKQSILSGGGPVTLDFSSRTTDDIISALPGSVSSIGLRTDGTHAHDNLALPLGINVKEVIGGSGNDYILGGNATLLYGGAGNDTFAGCAAKVTVNGGAGFNKLEMAVASSQEHVLKLRGNAVAITDKNGDVALCRDIQQVQFTDSSIDTSALNVHDNIDMALTQIYLAAFRRAPETGGYNYWLQQEAAKGLTSVADIMFSLDIVKAIYPTGMTAVDFVTAIYQNVFNRAPDTDGLSYWVQQLTAKSRGHLVIDMTNAAISVPDRTNGKDYFQDRVDWALYAVGYQLDKLTEISPDHLTTLTNSVTADSATVISLIGQAESGVTI